MRTSLNIDNDLLAAARVLARRRRDPPAGQDRPWVLRGSIALVWNQGNAGDTDNNHTDQAN